MNSSDDRQPCAHGDCAHSLRAIRQAASPVSHRAQIVHVSLAVVATMLSATGLRAQEHDTVWVWNAECHNPFMIAIRVRLDSTTLYRSSIPTCRWERGREQGKNSFGFTARRALVWYGYRSDEGDSKKKDVGDTTAADTPFQIDLWQAGGEVESIQLGVTATAPDGLHMNTIHVLRPGRRGRTTLAPGLVLETWPEAGRSTSRSPRP